VAGLLTEPPGRPQVSPESPWPNVYRETFGRRGGSVRRPATTGDSGFIVSERSYFP